MASQIPYNNLGKLSAGDQQPLVLDNNSLNVWEIVPREFSDLYNFTTLSLDTFTTNFIGFSTPSLCTGLVYWISEEIGGAPVSNGLQGGNVNVSNTGKIDLTWGLSFDPANAATSYGGNVTYNVDYILEYPDINANVSTYYLNVAYASDNCLSNVANCNVSVPVENIYTGGCNSAETTFVGIQTLGQKHCASYLGDFNNNSNSSTISTVTIMTDDKYYPFGTSDLVLPANSTLYASVDISLLDLTKKYDGIIYAENKLSTSSAIMTIGTGVTSSMTTTNGCEATKLITDSGAQLTLKYNGNNTNRDVDISNIFANTFNLRIQAHDPTGNGTATTSIKAPYIQLKEVTEDDANINYIAPLTSTTEVIPVGTASGINTVFDFPESGEYLISAHYTDSTGAVYQQNKTVTVDVNQQGFNSPKVAPRDPTYTAGETIVRGFLGYGPGYNCTPGKYANDPIYASIGKQFTYNGSIYNMTSNMAGCLAFNCLDHCLGVNTRATGPNGPSSRGTVDNCVSGFYGTNESSGTIINWTNTGFTDVFDSVSSEILFYPLVVPTKNLSGTNSVHGSLEVKGNNVLIWISTEPGGGPNNCYGFLDSYDSYYSINGVIKFYASFNNGIISDLTKSHAQLEMGKTYYVNIARVSGNLQNFKNGKELTFVKNKNLTVNFKGMSSWNYLSTGSTVLAGGVSTAPAVDGTTNANISASAEVLPVTYSVDENYGICAETWDSGETSTTGIKVNPFSRVAMPFTTTTKMYKGKFSFTTGSKNFDAAENISAYIVDAPEKTKDSAYGKVIKGTYNSVMGAELVYDIEVLVANYSGTKSSDAILKQFTTYYIVLENNTSSVFTGERMLNMVYSSDYGLPNTNYDLYPPWCINTPKMNVGGAPDSIDSRGIYGRPTEKLGADINCQFYDNQTYNYYKLGQQFTIKGQNVICNRLIAECLKDKARPTVQDVLRCAGIFHDSLNPDTPFPNPNGGGHLGYNNDNVPNLSAPDPEILTFSTGSGMNTYSSSPTSPNAEILVLNGGATSVDPSVRDAINNKDFSQFNLYGLKNNAFTGLQKEVNWQDYLNQFEKYGNYSGFSNYPLTGDSSVMPSNFRIKKRKVKNPNLYGFNIPLKDGRFVNATSQRVTGGSIKPLAQPLKIVPRIPRAIKTYNVRDEAYGKVVPSNLNQTYRNTYYNPRSVGAYFSTKGRQIQNISNTGFIADPNDTNVPGGGFLASSGAGESVPGNNPRIANEVLDTQGGEDYTLPDNLQPLADDINYAPEQGCSCTPLKLDENGNYVPAGPDAPIDLRQATPEASFSALDAASVADGSELYINDRKIVFKYGGSLESIKTQINCGKLGVTAVIGEDTSTGQQVLTISSCDSSPWTVANGCGGGTFQQVGDFHINRGFDQSKSVTGVFISQDQLIPANASSVGNTSIISIPYTDQNFPGTGRLVDINFDRSLYIDPTYPADKINKEEAKNFNDFAVPNTNPGIMLPQETVSVSTAGKGYRVGDRLRLVGGTPVNTNKGPLTVICIESAGAGYVNPAKLKVQIGDGSTPGFGAVGEVYSLDMNGGISEIRMLNYGVGYDPARPPKVTIIDNHSDSAYRSMASINGLNQFDEVVLTADDVFEFNYPEITESTDDAVSEAYIEVTQTYYRVSETVGTTELIIGGENKTNTCRMYYGGKTVDGNYPTINIADGSIFGNLVHTRYKAVIGMPRSQSVSRGQYIRLSSTGTGTNASIVNGTPDFLVSDHMIGKDDSGNDVLALNMPIIRHRALLNASTIDAIAEEMSTGNVTVTYAKPFLPNNTAGTFIPVAPYGIPKVEAELSALIGVDPDKVDENGINPVDPFISGYGPLGGPLRVAKFLVTSVDADGGIAGLKLMDRGLYKNFPSDLTFGIPLEYDTELLGSPSALQQLASKAGGETITSGQSLGGVDPLNDNILYGGIHPEYYDSASNAPISPFLIATNPDNNETGAKHPDWYRASEYKQVTVNGVTDEIYFWGTPGAYDPTTLLKVEELDEEGNPLRTIIAPKTLEFEIDAAGTPTKIKIPHTIAGGQGARVFLTAMDVPDCSEEGTAQQDLGLPDTVREIDGPKTFVEAANLGLQSVGYLPPDISWTVDGEGPIANVTLNSIYPGIRFNGLDWFGLPSDDYAVGALCIQATLSSPNLTVSQIQNELEELYQSSDAFGLTEQSFSLPNNFNSVYNNNDGTLNSAVLSLLCIDNIETDPNSVFGDGPVFATINELYKYDISNIYGQDVKLDGAKQEVDAFVFESRRFSDLDQVSLLDYLDDMEVKSQATIEIPQKLWVDSVTFENQSKANINARYPGFTQGGWGYFEDNIMTRWQTPLVDTRYIHNSIIYDPISGARTADLYPWDPFKGVLPGFIDKEIDYISESDPVVYTALRHQFGQQQVGAVWWDTSSIRYQWYEQGTNSERWANWGKAFPGSTIIICEWVESRAKPQNWNGDGTPRWIDRYITERRWDPVKQEYTFFYYYWVMNRTTVDARLAEKRNRKYDTRTIARYLSDPVGFGIHMISFLSSNAVMFSNLSDVLRDSGNHVQINLARDLDPDGIKHTAWKLVREDDDNSTIPDNITIKLTDSLAGENLVGQVVPDPSLSSVMSYGTEFRPRQSMFVNVKEARRTMAYVLNEIFANLKLYTDFPSWNQNLPSVDTWQYIERVTYYSTIYIDEKTNEPVRYDDSYKPIFNVETLSDLDALTNLPDGTVVQVAGTDLAEPQLWIYDEENSNFNLIAIVNDTIRFKDTIFTDDTNTQMSLEIRNVLNLFNDDLFQRFNFWNVLFFEMLKYAYMEQRQLDWAFKTTYLYVEKEEEDLIQISGFKPDNYQAILDYMDEAKPYTSKIREYRDGKSPPLENIGTIQPSDGIPGDGDYDDIDSGVPGIPGLPGPGEGPGDGPPSDVNPNAGLRSVSDYDKPPYPDPSTGTIRILDDFNQQDREIMATNGDYINYFRVDNKGQDPIRHIKTNLTYDRTNWRFTEYLWNANTTTLQQSITNNIVNLTTQTSQEVDGNTDVRAIDRIFKFDPVVINQFNLDIKNNYGVFDNNITYQANSYVRRPNQIQSASFDLYKSNKYVPPGTGFKTADWDLQTAPYTAIETNLDIVYDIVDSGNLNFTLALLKNRVGGDWQGETIDSNLFTKVVPGADPTYDYQTIFGYGTQEYEQFYWDVVQEVNNYVGIFKPPPEVNLRRNDRDYDGFDGISFLRVLYGEERPEELVQVDPYETFIVNCATNTETARIPIGAADRHIDPTTGNVVVGQNGNIEIVGGQIVAVNISDELIKRSYGTCRAIDIYASDNAAGANASFTLNLQTPPDGWPGGQSWPQMSNIQVDNGGVNYDAGNTTVWITAALNKNAQPVLFQIFESLFGQTDYSRVISASLLKEDLRSWSEEIVLEKPEVAPDPLPGRPGYIWIGGSELIKYFRKDPNTGVITQFQRGAEGTTIQDWYVSSNVEVWDGSVDSKFNNLNPQQNIWLETGFRYDPLYTWDDNNSNILLGNISQPGWDYGNIAEQTCNVTGIQFVREGVARFTLDCDIPPGVSFSKIKTDFTQGDIDYVISDSVFGNVMVMEAPLTNTLIISETLSGNANTISNVTLVPSGNERYNPYAVTRSNVFVTGSATGNISITEAYVPVLQPNANVTGFANITGQNVHEIANTINNMSLPTVRAIVDQVWQSGIQRDYLKIYGRYFLINEIDTPTLHIDTGTYFAEWFESRRATTNTFVIFDDLWTSEILIEGMSNTLVTFNISLDDIPWDYAEAEGFPALSLADLANTDSNNPASIMKFLHGVDSPATGS